MTTEVIEEFKEVTAEVVDDFCDENPCSVNGNTSVDK